MKRALLIAVAMTLTFAVSACGTRSSQRRSRRCVFATTKGQLTGWTGVYARARSLHPRKLHNGYEKTRRGVLASTWRAHRHRPNVVPPCGRVRYRFG
jgi:hypothetical protein